MSIPASSPGSREEENCDEPSSTVVDGDGVTQTTASLEEEAHRGPEDEHAPAEDSQPTPEVVQLDPLAVAEQKLADSEARLRMVSKAYTNLQQDMAAFRKRVEEQGKLKGNLKAFETVKTFFEPCQNLRRSLKDCGEDIGALVDGLRLILQQFDAGLEALGLAEVGGEGEPFNPEYHEALALTPVAEQSLDGRVIMVHRAGYAVNGKVLQAAQVIVGKFTEEETPEA